MKHGETRERNDKTVGVIAIDSSAISAKHSRGRKKKGERQMEAEEKRNESS